MVIFHTVLFYIALVVATLILGILVIITAAVTRQQRLAHSYGKLWSRIILFASGVKLKIYGQEKIKPGGSYIFAANHSSQFDIFVLYRAIPVEFKWLAKIELFRIPILGHAMNAIGYIPIDRANRKAAFKSIDKAAKEVKSGTSVVIFPEGTRSLDGILQDFKKGGFILAIKSQQPIVPVSIKGSQHVLPKGTWKVTPGTIVVRFGKPIETRGMVVRDRDKLIEMVRRGLLENLPKEQRPNREGQ